MKNLLLAVFLLCSTSAAFTQNLTVSNHTDCDVIVTAIWYDGTCLATMSAPTTIPALTLGVVMAAPPGTHLEAAHVTDGCGYLNLNVVGAWAGCVAGSPNDSGSRCDCYSGLQNASLIGTPGSPILHIY